MLVLVVLAHPNKSSLNHAIADRAITSLRRNGHEVIFHDLYDEKFDPVLPVSEVMREGSVDPKVEQYAKELTAADGIVVVHPNWWGSMPAILKGWVDRVFRPGCAYSFEEVEGKVGVAVGHLKSKDVVILNTENTPKEVREEQGDPLEVMWKNTIFGLCGARRFQRRMFHGVIMAEKPIIDSWLAEVEDIMNQAFPSAEARAAA